MVCNTRYGRLRRHASSSLFALFRDDGGLEELTVSQFAGEQPRDDGTTVDFRKVVEAAGGWRTIS